MFACRDHGGWPLAVFRHSTAFEEQVRARLMAEVQLMPTAVQMPPHLHSKLDFLQTAASHAEMAQKNGVGRRESNGIASEHG